MPMSAVQRAEKVLLNISYALRNLQTEAYALQDRTAQKTHEVYDKKAWLLRGKSVIEGLSLVGSVAVFAYYQNQLFQVGPAPTPPALPAQANLRTQSAKIRHEIAQTIYYAAEKRYDEARKPLQDRQSHGVEWSRQVASVLSSVAVDSPNVSCDSELQRLGIQQQENSSFQSGWQSTIQTHETALQRLQNIENSAKNG